MEGKNEEFTDQLDLLISLQQEGEQCYRLLSEGNDSDLNQLFLQCGAVKKDQNIDLKAVLLVIEEDPEENRISPLFDPLPFSELKEANKKWELVDRVYACIQNEAITINAYKDLIDWMNDNNTWHPKMISVFTEHLAAIKELHTLLTQEYNNLIKINSNFISNLNSQLS